MPPKIANTVVTTGPDDSLVAVDAYGSTPDAASEKLAKSPENNTGVVGTAKQLSISPMELASAIKFEDGSPGLDSAKVKDAVLSNTISNIVGNGEAGARIDEVAGQSLTSIPGVDKDVKVLAESLMPGILEHPVTSVVDDLGNIWNIAEGADTSSVAGITKAVKNLVGDSVIGNLIDGSAHIATGLSLLDKAIELGVPDLIDDLLKGMKDDKLARERLIRNTLSVIMASDIPTLNKIIDWVGAEGVLARVPNATTLLLSTYKFPRKTNPTQYESKANELLAVLNRIDSNWDKEKRGDVLLEALAPFYRISSGAKTVLQSKDDTYTTRIIMAGDYPPMDMEVIARKDFPRMSIW